MNNFKFIGSAEMTIDDKCRVTLPVKFRNKLTKPLAIKQFEGALMLYESDDGISLDSQNRLKIGAENTEYLCNRNVVISGRGNHILIEDEKLALKVENLTPKFISEIYDSNQQ